MKKHLLLFILVLQSIVISSQISFKERDYKITYHENSIDLKFDYPVTAKAFSGRYHNDEVVLENKITNQLVYTLRDTPPGSIIKLND